MFPSGREICRRRVGVTLREKGEYEPCRLVHPLPHPLPSSDLTHLVWDERFLMGCLHPCQLGLAFHFGGLLALAGLCRSLA